MRTEITTEDALREMLGFPMQRALDKHRAAFTPEHREWLAASPFCLVATSEDTRHTLLDNITPRGHGIAARSARGLCVASQEPSASDLRT